MTSAKQKKGTKIGKPVCADRIFRSAIQVALLSACSSFFLACGIQSGDPQWLDADAAALRCAPAGEHELFASFVDAPGPQVPTGFYSERMNPRGLFQLGFEEDSVVCASLDAPPEQELDELRLKLSQLQEQRRKFERVFNKQGYCGCEMLDRLDSEELVPGCARLPTRESCFEQDLDPELERSLGDVKAIVQETRFPMLHWRMFGKSDRLGYRIKEIQKRFRFHDRGSKIYKAGGPLSASEERGPIGALLKSENVVAVIRQDSGRSLLVVREFGAGYRGSLVFDYFSQLLWDDHRSRLWAFYDSVRPDRFVDALSAPEQTRKLSFDPRKGFVVAWDAEALDRLELAMKILSGREEVTDGEGDEMAEDDDSAGEGASEPSGENTSVKNGNAEFVGGSRRPNSGRKFSEVEVHFPFAAKGKVLEASLTFGSSGQAWMEQHRQDSALALWSLGTEVIPNSPVADDSDDRDDDEVGMDFVRSFSRLDFNALRARFEAIENAAPGSIRGSAKEWSLQLPAGLMPGSPETWPALRPWRERWSKRPHKVSGRLAADGSKMELRIEPHSG